MSTATTSLFHLALVSVTESVFNESVSSTSSSSISSTSSSSISSTRSSTISSTIPTIISSTTSATIPSSPSPTADDVIVGICMTVCSFLCILPNLVVMIAIKKDKDLYRLNAYKIMVFMSYFDIAQLLVHSITGIFNCFQSIFNHTFAKLLGAVATPSYVTYAVMTVVLSLNRLTQLCFPRADKIIFSKTAMNFWYGIGFTFFGIFSGALASPFATIIYLPEYWSWDYLQDGYPGSRLVQTVEMIIEIGGIPISGIIYLYVFVVLIIKRRKFTTSKDYRAELKVLIQAVVITVYCSILNIFWHNYTVLLPATNLAYSLLNFMWIFNGAVNPIIYYIVNATIRRNTSFKIRNVDHLTMVTRSPTVNFNTEKTRYQATTNIKAHPVDGQRKLVFVT